MVEAGWGAQFLIYPSLPQTMTWLGVQQLDNPVAAIAEAYQRHCVVLRDLRLVGRFDYFQVHQASGCGSGRMTWTRAHQDLDLPP